MSVLLVLVLLVGIIGVVGVSVGVSVSRAVGYVWD